MIRPPQHAADAYIAVIRFDKTIGPVLVWTTEYDILIRASMNDSTKIKEHAELDIAFLDTLPMFALPEGGSSKRKSVRGNSDEKNNSPSNKQNKSFQLEITNESRFLLPIGSNNEVLFGCSVYVVVAESFCNGGRGASQFAVAILTKAPAMEMLLDRLRSVASVFVRAQFGEFGVRLEDGLTKSAKEVLLSLHQSISPTKLLNGVQDFGALVPCIKLLTMRLRDQCWSLLKLILLEGRVLLYSKYQAIASQSCWALASLLPGTITAGLGFESPASAVPLFRWRKHGLPLFVFSNQCVLAPSVPMSDSDRVFSHSGYLAATSNQMIGSLPKACPDVIFDLDSGVLTRASIGSSSSASSSSFLTTTLTEEQKAQQRRLTAALDSSGGGAGYFFQQLIEAIDDHHPHLKKKSLSSTQTGLANWTTQLSSVSSSTTVSTATPMSINSSNLDDGFDSDDDCVGVSSSSWEGSEGWVHAEIQSFLEGVLGEGEVALETEMRQELKNNDKQIENVGGATQKDHASISFWGASGWARKMEEAAMEVANRADALAYERGWNGSGSATKLLRQKSAVASGLTSTLAPALGPDFTSLWINTNNHKIWKEQIMMKINSKINKKKSESVENMVENDEKVLNVVVNNENQGYLFSLLGTAASSLLKYQLGETGHDCPSSGTSEFVYPNGDRYHGEWLNGQRHGRGVCVYAMSGDKHDGSWAQDMPHGQGTFTTGSGDFIYDGNWALGRQSGTGHAVWHGRRESYTGEFEDGEFHGTGVHCSCDGDIYNGEFVKGRRNGVGTLQKCVEHDTAPLSNRIAVVWTRQGVQQKGDFTSDCKSSTLFSLASRSWIKYSGEWCDGVREGVGTCTYLDGSTYTGSWRFDKPFGEGEFRTKSLDDDNDEEKEDIMIFNGEWQHGLRHGEGKEEIMVNGEHKWFSREGRWERDDPIAGEWCLVWRQKSNEMNKSTIKFDMNEAWYGEGNRSYVGYACEGGLPEGVGTMKYKDTGAVYSGEWFCGQRHGQGVCVYSDGSYHKGQWRDDTPVNRSLMLEEVSLADDWKAPSTTAAWPLGDNSVRQHAYSSDSNILTASDCEGMNKTPQIESLSRRGSFPTSKSLSLPLEQYDKSQYFEYVEDEDKYRQVSTCGLRELYGRWSNLEEVSSLRLSDDMPSFGETLIETMLPLCLNTSSDSLDPFLINSSLPKHSQQHKQPLSTNQNLFQINQSSVNGIGVSGEGRGVDALAGLVYEGKWLLGLPHGEGLLIKSAPAARISAMLNNIDLESGAVEWLYKGEFKYGKFSGVGYFERHFKSRDNLEASDNTTTSPSTISLSASTSSSSSSSSSSSIVAAALTATATSALNSKVKIDNDRILLDSMLPKDDSKSVPWEKGVKMIQSNQSLKGIDSSAPNEEVWKYLWFEFMQLSASTKWTKYSGEFLNGEICGTGTATYDNGDEYSGNWQGFNDRSMHDRRRQSQDQDEDGSSVNVDTMNETNKLLHRGALALHQIMVGELKSLPEGEGTWRNQDNTCNYHGSWSCGVAHGIGEFGVSYECEIPLGLKRSRQEEREGKWQRGFPEDGDWRISFHEISIRDDESQLSAMSSPDGGSDSKQMHGQFMGNILGGLPNGEGICKYPSGSLYSGGWKQGTRHGNGSLVWANGDAEFTGLWEEDGVVEGTKGRLRLSTGKEHQFGDD